MRKQFFSLVASLCLVGSAAAQTDTIEWTVVTDSLAGTVGGIQMHGSAALEINGEHMLYAVGGNRSSAGGDSVNITYAPLDLDPVATGAWVDTTFEFASDSNGFAIGSVYIERVTLTYNNRLYIVGGTHNSSPEPDPNKIRVFEPTATGDILVEATALGLDGATAGVTPSLSTFGSAAGIDASTGYLYVVGGVTDTTVRRFKIDPVTGAVSDYQLLSSNLLWPSYVSSGVVIKNGYLYVIDSNNTADRGKVQYAPINPDGTLGAFTQTTSLPVVHIDGGSAVLNGEIYVVGGHTGAGNTAVTNTVHRSVTGANGAITSWVAEPSIPGVAGLRRIGVASLGNDGFVVIGGRNNAEFPQNVYVAQPINASVDSWSLY